MTPPFLWVWPLSTLLDCQFRVWCNRVECRREFGFQKSEKNVCVCFFFWVSSRIKTSWWSVCCIYACIVIRSALDVSLHLSIGSYNMWARQPGSHRTKVNSRVYFFITHTFFRPPRVMIGFWRTSECPRPNQNNVRAHISPAIHCCCWFVYVIGVRYPAVEISFLLLPPCRNTTTL